MDGLLLLLTYAQAAQLIGIPINTLYALVSQRRIPHVRLGPRFVRFPKDQLLAWVQSKAVAVGDEQSIP